MELKIAYILLAIATLIILAVLLEVFSFKTNKSANKQESGSIDDILADVEVEDELEGLLDLPPKDEIKLETIDLLDEIIIENKSSKKNQKTQKEPYDVFSLILRARNERGISGSLLEKCLQDKDFRFDKETEIFEYTKLGFEGEIKVMQALNPGVFDLVKMPNSRYPAIAILMIEDPAYNLSVVFDEVIRIAKHLAYKLNGELLDFKQQRLTHEQVKLYQMKFSGNNNERNKK